MPNPDRVVEMVRWQLAEYGYDHMDPELDVIEFSEAQQRLDGLRNEFVDRERAWMRRHLLPRERELIRRSINAHAMGYSIDRDDPLVTRPHTYSSLLQYREFDSSLKSKLLTRALAVVRSPVDRHYVLLAALRKSKIEFSEAERSELLRLFKGNRPAAEALMIEEYGALPPDLGDELLNMG